ncbi:DUF6160 family protein [Acinetobacter sp. ASP199]|uniref:DUF6160 family protein n=1 Tax=unclassified Acinetobacter TaxID=196816 RepID=UPI001F6156F3|nr:DUF6160 family protein [Acinetobacter sp. ASP199]UNT60648.1 hypothetical protein IHE35_10985 [Acinetobacter sp. ASP199]
MKTKKMQLKLLTVCVFLAQQTYALEVIQDQDLGQVTGQDGLSLTHEVSKVYIEQANWLDPTGDQNVQRGLGLHQVNVLGVDNNPIVSQLHLDVGATEVGTGIRLAFSVDPFNAEANLNIVEKACSGPTCHAINRNTANISSLGKLGIQTNSPIKMLLQTQAGLFNSKELAYLDFQLQNANISHALGNNKTLLKDFNFNFSGFGYMSVNQHEGIVLSTYNTAEKPGIDSETNIVHLGRVADSTDVAAGRINATNPGINLDLRYVTQQDATSPAVVKNIMRMGASGDITNAKIFMNGNQSNITKFGVNTNGQAYNALTGYESITNTGGLHLGISTDFTNASNSQNAPTKLEIGHTGQGSYAIEFSNLRALTKQQNAYIDFGDIYVNTISGKSLDFLINENLKNTLMQNDHIRKQNLNATENYAFIAVRGMDFQSIASKARFISDNSIAALTGDGGSWGIGIPIYNLNANVALTGTTYDGKQGIAYNVLASTEGYGIDAKTGLPSTTSILLIDGQDGVHGEAVNYYAGLRNIDALIQAEGVIGYEDSGLYIRADDLLIAAQAELAIGQLPGSKYNCTSGSALCGAVVANDSFSKPDDVLTTIALKLDGSGELRIIPGVDPTPADPDSNYLGLKGNFKFKDLTAAQRDDENYVGSYFSLINKDIGENGQVVQSSALTLNSLEGNLGFDTKVKLSADTVTLDSQIDLNHTKDLANPFRTNFAMTTNNTMQNMASIALTGGTMRSTLGITPR